MTLSDHDSSLRTVCSRISKRLPRARIRIYEAGGGSMSYLTREILDRARLTTIDIDDAQLKKNKYADVKILGDIQVYAPAPNSFDLIVCYNVIEHLTAPDQALRHFHRALKPGGMIFVGAPNPSSFSGFVTKYTPHWFHVWYYRVILRRPHAGEPGEPPFRTVFHPVVHPFALLKFFRERGYEPVYFRPFQSPRYQDLRNNRPVIGSILSGVLTAVYVLSLRRWDPRNGDYHAVFQKSHPLIRSERRTGKSSARKKLSRQVGPAMR